MASTIELRDFTDGRAWEFTHDGITYRLVNYNGSDKVELYFLHDGQPVIRGTRTTEVRDAFSVANEWAREVTRPTVSATMTVTYTVTVDRDAWAERGGLNASQAPTDLAEWLQNQVRHAITLPSDLLADAGTVAVKVHTPALIEITDNEARAFARDLARALERRPGLYSIQLDPRGDGVAVKINEGDWLPTIGAVISR